MNVVELIRRAAAHGTTRFAFELLPPLKGDSKRSVYDAIDPLTDFDPAYINVTYHRESLKRTKLPDGTFEEHVVRRRPGTVGISAAIQKKYGIETVHHLICGGLSKYDIEDALIDMDFLGLHNVLALRGDKRRNEPLFAPHPQGHADVPIIPGLKPLATSQHLTVLPEVFGVHIPEALRREAEARPDAVREVGIEWAAAQARELKAAGVPVIHFYTMGRTDNIRRIAQSVF